MRTKSTTCLPQLGVRVRQMQAINCPWCGLQVYFDDAARRSYHELPVCQRYKQECKSAEFEGEIEIHEVHREPRTDD